MLHDTLAAPGADSGLKQLLLSGLGPGQDWTAWPGGGHQLPCHRIRRRGGHRAPEQVRGGRGGDDSAPWKADRGRNPTGGKGRAPGQGRPLSWAAGGSRDVAYTPGGKGRPWEGAWTHRTQSPGSQNPLHTPGVCPRHSSHATKVPHKSSNTHTILTAPPHTERATGACPPGLPTKDPEVQGERCVWSATEKSAVWPPPPLIGVCPRHAGEQMPA